MEHSTAFYRRRHRIEKRSAEALERGGMFHGRRGFGGQKGGVSLECLYEALRRCTFNKTFHPTVTVIKEAD